MFNVECNACCVSVSTCSHLSSALFRWMFLNLDRLIIDGWSFTVSKPLGLPLWDQLNSAVFRSKGGGFLVMTQSDCPNLCPSTSAQRDGKKETTRNNTTLIIDSHCKHLQNICFSKSLLESTWKHRQAWTKWIKVVHPKCHVLVLVSQPKERFRIFGGVGVGVRMPGKGQPG